MGIIDDVGKEIKQEMKERNNDKGVLDIITEKAISRKFLVWVVSSTFLFFGRITPDEWAAITLGYVGIEGFADIAIRWKGAGK